MYEKCRLIFVSFGIMNFSAKAYGYFPVSFLFYLLIYLVIESEIRLLTKTASITRVLRRIEL